MMHSIYLVGIIDQEDRERWDLIGVFATVVDAERECDCVDCFIKPITIGEVVDPDDIWKGVWFPKGEPDVPKPAPAEFQPGGGMMIV